tara:strand:+ start:44 stop:448 length:405 start_codon:yes stop_codon:yes gene_type:complete
MTVQNCKWCNKSPKKDTELQYLKSNDDGEWDANSWLEWDDLKNNVSDYRRKLPKGDEWDKHAETPNTFPEWPPTNCTVLSYKRDSFNMKTRIVWNGGYLPHKYGNGLFCKTTCAVRYAVWAEGFMRHAMQIKDK